MLRPLGRAITNFNMISPGDQILLGISGGKDSLVMAYLLHDLRKRSPVKYELSAITINPGPPYGYERKQRDLLKKFLNNIGIDYYVEPTSISRIVQEHPGKKSPCSLCANLRRGALYKKARELGFAKVAFAHHLDDAIETLFLNMFYQGTFRCFQPNTFLTRTKIRLIRPLVYVEESLIAQLAREFDLPITGTNCPFSESSHRRSMKILIRKLAGEIPGFHNQMRGVLQKLWFSR